MVLSFKKSLVLRNVLIEIPQMQESDLAGSPHSSHDDPDNDDLDQLTLKIDHTDQN